MVNIGQRLITKSNPLNFKNNRLLFVVVLNMNVNAGRSETPSEAKNSGWFLCHSRELHGMKGSDFYFEIFMTF